ncbi:MAG: M14 family zinc carboxypeptidase [Candidatus Glassbacteria bacterium]
MKSFFAVIACTFLLAGPAGAHVYIAAGSHEPFVPGASYDPAVPTLAQTIGRDWGEGITTHAECERYLHALAGASPRARLFSYGETWEGRKLYYLVIAAEARLGNLDRIKSQLRELAQPLNLGEARKAELVNSLPAVVWIACTVHGDESSGSEAGLWLAYHLLASQNDPVVEKIFEECIVVIDPLQNPDGHDRFANYFRQTTGRWPDADPFAAERSQSWPGGRTNHYLFDLNRDWFVMNHLETRGKVAAFLEWRPHVYLDLHEMESDATFYFPPTAPPVNRELSPGQVAWFSEFGRNNAAWFDKFGFRYYSRESFDAYYPGYGCTWPSLNGAIGMTYEQASSRGLAVQRRDEAVMNFAETVRHHAVASLATTELASRSRQKLLADFTVTRTPPATIPAGRAYIIPPGRDPSRSRKLVGILVHQGLKVQRATSAFSARSLTGADRRLVSQISFPEGTWVVPARQESYRLLANLLEPEVPMDSAYLAEQERRLAAGLDDQVYDITAWSLPVLFNVECYRTDNLPGPGLEELTAPPAAPAAMAKEAGLAYVLDGTSDASLAALADLLRRKVRVYTNDLPFAQGGKKFSRGSLILPVKDNPADLHQTVAEIERLYGVEFYATGSGWMSDGIDFGSPNVSFVPEAKVLLAWNEPTSSNSAGATRYVIERQYGLPVTAVRTADLGRIEIEGYNVLVLPSGWNFGQEMGKPAVERITDWVRRGGTLIALQGATRWLVDPEVKLLEADIQYRLDEKEQPKKEEKKEEKTNRVPGTQIKSFAEFFQAIQAEKRDPQSLPGGLARIRLDLDHWLSSGYDSTAVAFAFGSQVYSPLKRDQGRNVAYFEAADRLIVSGHTWRGPGREQLAFKPYLMYRSLGRGHVVAFTEDPNFRAFCDGVSRLFINAVLLGPAH